MRVVAVAILAVLAAGCVAPDAPNPNPLFGLCPQWEDGPGQQAVAVALNGTVRDAAQVLAPEHLYQHGRPFDMLRIRIDGLQLGGGGLQLRAFIGNGTSTQVNWRDFRPDPPSIIPVIAFAPGNNETGHEFEVFLTSISQDQTPRPGPVALHWELVGNGTAVVAYTASFHYKVCGAALSGKSLA